MSQEEIFVVCIIIPFGIIGVLFVFTQMNFLKRYREVYPDDKKLVSSMEFGKLFQEDPMKALAYLKKNFFYFSFQRAGIYFKNYQDKKLNSIASLIKGLTIFLFLFPFGGILLLFLLT